MHLFSNRSQKTSKCGKNISETRRLGYHLPTSMFISHFDLMLCDQLLNRHMATWNLFVINCTNGLPPIHKYMCKYCMGLCVQNVIHSEPYLKLMLGFSENHHYHEMQLQLCLQGGKMLRSHLVKIYVVHPLLLLTGKCMCLLF